LLNGYDVAPTVMTRCVGEKKYFPFLSLIYKRSSFWLDQEGFAKKAAAEGKELTTDLFLKYSGERINKLAKMVGVSKKKIAACSANADAKAYVLKVQQDGIQKYKINGTPSLIVNGRYIEGFQFENIEKAIKGEM
jgi:protein-disulfide isomerase